MNEYHSVSVLSSASSLRSLLDFDSKTCARVRAGRCRYCGRRLDTASYVRKPRGVPQEFEKDFSRRLSLCCSAEGCRKRTTPPSVCFLGRRAYIAVTFILLSMLRHGITDKREKQLRREFHAEFPADARTLSRWREWWQHILPAKPFWRGAKGLLGKAVLSADLPAGLVMSFLGDGSQQLMSMLKFLWPISTSSLGFWSGLTMVS